MVVGLFVESSVGLLSKGKNFKTITKVLQTTMNMIDALQLLKNKHLNYFYVINNTSDNGRYLCISH